MRRGAAVARAQRPLCRPACLEVEMQRFVQRRRQVLLVLAAVGAKPFPRQPRRSGRLAALSRLQRAHGVSRVR